MNPKLKMKKKDLTKSKSFKDSYYKYQQSTRNNKYTQISFAIEMQCSITTLSKYISLYELEVRKDAEIAALQQKQDDSNLNQD
jgi:hypothetical protein